MSGGAVAGLLDDGRLHLQHGPIDLIIEAFGTDHEVKRSYQRAWSRFETVLTELVAELPALRSPLPRDNEPGLEGPVARAMGAAVRPFSNVFITPMAAVAGAVADEILAAMTSGKRLRKAYVNNGGDIAIHLGTDQVFDIGLVGSAAEPERVGTVRLHREMTVGGCATSGRGGRSQSRGIADAATVLAATAAQADAAATLLANAVDLPGHPGILREPARASHPDSDLGDFLVTLEVGQLSAAEIEAALDRGASLADHMFRRGLISAAVLCLRGEVRVCQESLLPDLLTDAAETSSWKGVINERS